MLNGENDKINHILIKRINIDILNNIIINIYYTITKLMENVNLCIQKVAFYFLII